MTKLRLQLWLPACLLLGVLLMPVTVCAQGDVTVDLAADKQQVTVGDPIALTLTVTHSGDTRAIIPRLDSTWGPFEIRNQSPAETVTNPDGTVTTRATFVAALFAPGDYETPALPVTISDAGGLTTDYPAPVVPITVQSVLSPDDQELHDIKPQAAMALPPIWPWILGGLLAVILLAVFVRWLWHRLTQRGAQAAAAAVDNRPADEIAYAELARIEGLGLAEQGAYKAHYTLVTDCLRRYLEGQFQVRAMDRTTAEVRAELRISSLPADTGRRFVTLFEESDLVKFAKFVPQLAAARQLVDRARQLIDQTVPQPPANDPSGAASLKGDARPAEVRQ